MDDSFSNVLRIWRFVVKDLRGFGGLNSLSFTNLWFFGVFGSFWAWFQLPMRSRKMIWMISLQIFFEFLVSSKMCWFLGMCVCVLKCLRKASIYRSLGVDERHVVKFYWWHVSQFGWRSFKTFSPRHVASFDWPKCFDFQGDTC